MSWMHLLFYMSLTWRQRVKFFSFGQTMPNGGIASERGAGYSSGKHYRCIKESN